MPCHSTKDTYGTTFHVAAAEAPKNPKGRQLAGYPSVEVWWSRDFKAKDEETIVIRQEYPERSTADVLELTLGQVYDLIDALNKAVENT